MNDLKVALVYDRINKWGGAESVLMVLHELFPNAPLYTAVYDEKMAPWAKKFRNVIPSFLQKVPVLNKHHELLGAFTPIAFETFDFSGYDLVISVTSEAAKGVITSPATFHICYCLTPTRYLYSGFKDYLSNPPKKLSWIPFYKYISKPFLGYSKIWDGVASQRPDMYIAISKAVKDRIKKFYGRSSEIIYPPVDNEKFAGSNSKLAKKNPNHHLPTTNYYLIVGRLVPYKKVDLAIKTFIKLKKNLVIIGTGSEEEKYKFKYKNMKNIIFKGFVSDDKLPDYYRNAKALIYPQEEDFGITAVEAQASGCPVIAYRAGGALDTVLEGNTGVFFDKQDINSLTDAVRDFESKKFDKSEIISNANKYSKERFKKNFLDIVNRNVYHN